jgi:hypothetical protein
VEETPLDAVARDDRDAATAARTSVAIDGQRDALLDQLDAFLLVHSLAVVGVHEAVQVGAAGAADGGSLANESATDWDGVDLKTIEVCFKNKTFEIISFPKILFLPNFIEVQWKLINVITDNIKIIMLMQSTDTG